MSRQLLAAVAESSEINDAVNACSAGGVGEILRCLAIFVFKFS
jgi:hypothetical protein